MEICTSAIHNVVKYSAEQKWFIYDTYFTEFFMEKWRRKYPDLTVPCKATRVSSVIVAGQKQISE
jgi:hypothetical protein